MYDIHSHVLPAIDDGSESFEMSLTLVRQAAADGVKTLVCTPHCSSGTLVAMLDKRDAALATLSAAIAEENLDITLVPGVEYCADGHAVEWALREPRCRLGATEGNPILVELPFTIELALAGNLLFQATRMNCPMILAHPERYNGFLEKQSDLLSWMERGLYLQFNADSLQDGGWMFFRRIPKAILSLMKAYPEQVIIASDAHHPELRPARLSTARALVVRTLGEAAWQKCTVETPERLLKLAR